MKKSFNKNELILIVVGILLFLIIIFLIFLKTSYNKNLFVDNQDSKISLNDIQERLVKLEALMQTLEKQGFLDGTSIEQQNKKNSILENRIKKIETAFVIKFDSLTKQINKIGKSIPIKKSLKNINPVSNNNKDADLKVTLNLKKNTNEQKIKSQNEFIYHSVKQGETLYSISQKYDTNVGTLRRINNFSDQTQIYPGDQIIVP